MNIWTLPMTASIGGTVYKINTDYRDVLEIISYMNDREKPEYIRWQIAISLFYEGDIPEDHQQEAMEYLSSFISYMSEDKKPGPKLIDWEQDAQAIIADVNKVSGVQDIRSIPFLHWWTFLSYFNAIGEGQLSYIVSIRSKKLRGKKLEKWEEEFYRENRDRIDFKTKKTNEEIEAQAYFDKWL